MKDRQTEAGTYDSPNRWSDDGDNDDMPSTYFFLYLHWYKTVGVDCE